MSKIREASIKQLEEVGLTVADFSPRWRPAKCKGCKKKTREGCFLGPDGLCEDCAPVTGSTCRTAPFDCEVGRVVNWKAAPADVLERLRLCSGHATMRRRELERRGVAGKEERA